MLEDLRVWLFIYNKSQLSLSKKGLYWVKFHAMALPPKN